jgi:hypothetical protein
MFKHIFIIFVLLLTKSISDSSTIVELGKVYDISLTATQHFSFQIDIPNKITKNQNLYIVGYSPVNDPYQ